MMGWHAERGWHDVDPNTLTPQQKIAVIIDVRDGARLDAEGGYPSNYVIENGKIYWATVDHDGGPELIVRGVDEFITENEWVFAE